MGWLRNDLAPVGVCVYDRLEHLRRCIEALKKNPLSDRTNLFVFSDAARPGDEAKIQAVRDYLRTVDGFQAVNIIERLKNDRVANNRGGMRFLIKKYGRLIWLEDDIETAPGFLHFMNQALDFYRQNKKVFSISGYCPPIPLPASMEFDVFALRRFTAWGFATWSDRFQKIRPVSSREFERLSRNRKKLIKLVANGQDVYRMLRKEAEGKLNALDVRSMFYQFKSNTLTIYPRKSLTQNRGFDGSGLHCNVNDAFEVELWDKKDGFRLDPRPKPNSGIVRANYLFREALFPRAKKIVEDLYH